MDTSTQLRAGGRVEKHLVMNPTTWLDNTNLTNQPIANVAFRQLCSDRLFWLWKGLVSPFPTGFISLSLCSRSADDGGPTLLCYQAGNDNSISLYL